MKAAAQQHLLDRHKSTAGVSCHGAGASRDGSSLTTPAQTQQCGKLGVLVWETMSTDTAGMSC
jgi:hypothetical protein